MNSVYFLNIVLLSHLSSVKTSRDGPKRKEYRVITVIISNQKG